MRENENRRTEELARLYDILKEATPGTDEYDKVHAEILKIEAMTNETQKVHDARNDAKRNCWITIGIAIGGWTVAKLIDLACKRNLAKHIGKVEQFETYTSSPGRSISGWFKFKD